MSAAIILFVVAIATLAQEQTDDAPIRVRTILLNIPVVATDKTGRNVAGLKKEDFFVMQDGERQPIEFFADTEGPMTVAIVMDLSGSVTGLEWDMKRAAKKFIDTFGPSDQGIIYSFAFEHYRMSKLTSDKKELKGSIDSAFVNDTGASNLHDVLYQILARDFAEVTGKKAIVVLSDGLVGGRKVKKEKLFDALAKSDTVIYPIYYRIGRVHKVEMITMNELVKRPGVSYLNEMALATGGRIYAAGADTFEGSFQKIADELKKHYIIGFYPKGPEERRTNNIAINIDRSDVFIRTKKHIRLRPPKVNLSRTNK